MKGIYIDVETGGLDPSTCALLSIGAVAFNSDAIDATPDNTRNKWAAEGGLLTVMGTWSVLVEPHESLTVCGRALSVQKVDWASVGDKSRRDEEYAYHSLIRFIEQHLGDDWSIMQLWAHNAAFDNGFLISLEGRVTGGDSVFHDRPLMSCSKALCHSLIGAGKMAPPFIEAAGTGLQSLARHMHVRGAGQAHDALADAYTGTCVLGHLFRIAGWLG